MILPPYISGKRKGLNLSPEYPAQALLDKFTSQAMQKIYDHLQNNNGNIAVVPAN